MNDNFDLKSNIYVEKREQFSYPCKEYAFSPSVNYPEYLFNDIADEPNEIYDMVRSLLYGMELDVEHYSTSYWNPLGEIINPGDDVVIKPSMVIHRHLADESLGTAAVITNPSIVRAVADYCLIALEGKGSLTIGDAPIQSCDFDSLIHSSGYAELFNFYHLHGIEVKFKDFRLTQSSKIRRVGISNISDLKECAGDDEGYIAVNIGKDSMLMDRIEHYERMMVTNYDPRNMKIHHNPEVNEYLIPKSILNADVIINIPKPKTHRKAGITAAMKNLVGINGHKDWLPHHTRGPKSEGGDEYLFKSLLKHLHTLATERADVAGITGRSFVAFCWSIVSRAFMLAAKFFCKDKFFEGSWYGNDTIWRTVCDLNRILMYSNKQGVLCEERQRKYMQIGDIIISGEGEGPLKPIPKKIGIIAGALNPLAFDTAICSLMGFDWKKVPNIRGAYGISTYPIQEAARESLCIRSNEQEWDKVNPLDVSMKKSFQYRPSEGWLGHIELGGIEHES